MKTSSKILLGVSIALLILLVTLFTQYLNETEPDLTEPQARVMLDKLAKAFELKARYEIERVRKEVARSQT